jgi:hypothetical protein
VSPARPGWLSAAGLAVAAALAFVTALWEAFLAPLMVHWTSGGHAHYARVPVAVAGAVVGNAALAWFTRQVTRNVLAVAVPLVAWAVPMFFASTKTREGDLVLAGNNWVAIVTLVAGLFTFVLAAFSLAVLPAVRPPSATPSKL